MPRQARVLLDGSCYHLLTRGNNRAPVFHDAADFQRYGQLLLEYFPASRVTLYHYCLMTNHLHLLVRLEAGGDLHKLMQFLLLGYSRWYRTKTDYVGHLWQGRYKSLSITQESYLLECSRYIERNPLRVGLVERTEEYRWSSYRHYALGEQNPLLDDDPYYLHLGPDAPTRQQRYRDFVKLEGPYDGIVDDALVEAHF